MGVSALFLATALVVYAIAALRLLLWIRGRRRPTEIPLITIAAALGTAFVTLAPVVQSTLSELVPALGRLLSNICTLTAAFGMLHLLLYVGHQPERVPAKLRSRLVALVLALAGLVVSFGFSDPPANGLFGGLYREQPLLVGYTLIYSLYLGSAVVELAVLTARSIRFTRGWLRSGMALLALGSSLASAYLIHKVVGLLSQTVMGSAPVGYCPSAFAGVGCTFVVGFPALSVLAIILGAALPTLGPRAEQVIRTLGHRRSYRRLHPLWMTLHTAMPAIAFATEADRDSSPGQAISDRLYRRVVAIRDGLLLLRPYRSADDTHRHRAQAHESGFPESRKPAVVEARDILLALRRQERDAPVGDHDDAGPAEPYQDLTSEITWLTRVSDELATTRPHLEDRH